MFEEAFDNHGGALIVPCNCRGSMKYVHRSCLNRWRLLSKRDSSYTHCEQCGFQYIINKNIIGKICDDNRAHVAISVALFSVVLLTGMAILTVIPVLQCFEFLTEFMDINNTVEMTYIHTIVDRSPIYKFYYRRFF